MELGTFVAMYNKDLTEWKTFSNVYGPCWIDRLSNSKDIDSTF